MHSSTPRLYLASQSPRRAELLKQIGISYQLLKVDVDETPLDDELPDDYVTRVAAAKSHQGWQQLAQSGLQLLPVLGADTSVILEGQILGKPRDRDHALTMLGSLSGKTHKVMTALNYSYRSKAWAALSVTDVKFRDISTDEIEQYWQSGEPIGKAGAYAIQGFGAVFIERIEGSYSSVVGLPLLETSQLLEVIEKTAFYE